MSLNGLTATKASQLASIRILSGQLLAIQLEVLQPDLVVHVRVKECYQGDKNGPQMPWAIVPEERTISQWKSLKGSQMTLKSC